MGYLSSVLTLPNLITVVRIVMTPIIVASFYLDNAVLGRRIAAILFLIASATDFLDGFLARRLKLQSAFGKMLDPIADKFMVSSILLMIFYLFSFSI